MDIVYDNNAIKKRCEKAKGKLKQRLDDIRAADSLAVLLTLPGRYHRLGANRSGEWACHLEEPYRLIFRPLERSSGISGVGDRAGDTPGTVHIIEVVDYHERKNRK